MRILFVTILTFLNFILESTVFQYIKILGIKPDFIIMLITSYAIMWGSGYGGYIGLLSGLLIDLSYSKAFGVNALSYMVTGYIIGQSQENVFKDSFIPPIILNIAGVFIYQNLFYMITYFSKTDISYVHGLINIVIPQSIYNGIFGIVVYRFIYRLDGKEFMDRRIY
mgnify:CR=1 FL=1